MNLCINAWWSTCSVLHGLTETTEKFVSSNLDYGFVILHILMCVKLGRWPHEQNMSTSSDSNIY